MAPCRDARIRTPSGSRCSTWGAGDKTGPTSPAPRPPAPVAAPPAAAPAAPTTSATRRPTADPPARHLVAYALKRGAPAQHRLHRRRRGLVGSNAPRWVGLGDIEAALREGRLDLRKLREQRERARSYQLQARIDWATARPCPSSARRCWWCSIPRHRRGAQQRRAGAARRAARLTLVGLPHTALPEQIRDAGAELAAAPGAAHLPGARRRISPNSACGAAPRSRRRRRAGAAPAPTARCASTGAWCTSRCRPSTTSSPTNRPPARMNHSPRFWDVVRSVLPDYERMRGQLKDDVLPAFGEAGSPPPVWADAAAPLSASAGGVRPKGDGDDGCGDARVGQPGVVAARDLADGGGRGRGRSCRCCPARCWCWPASSSARGSTASRASRAGRSASSPCWPCSPWATDYLAALLGAKKAGASPAAVAGAAIGTLLGIFTGFVGTALHAPARRDGRRGTGTRRAATAASCIPASMCWRAGGRARRRRHLAGPVDRHRREGGAHLLMIGVFAVAYWSEQAWR